MKHLLNHKGWLPGAAAALLLFYTLAVACMLYTNTPRYVFSADPEYCYLFAMLSTARLDPVYYTDHPGATLHVVGALMLRAAHLFGAHTDLLTDVLGQPEFYLCAVNLGLVALHLLALAGAAWLAWRITRNALAALCVLLTPLFSLYHFTWCMSQVRAETMLYTAALILGTVMIGMRSTWRAAHPAWLALAAALSVGFGIATKLGFAPLALCPLIALPRWRWRLLYCASLPVASLVFFGPALLHFSVHKNVMPWIMRSGTYGWGGRFWSAHQAHTVLREMLRVEPLVFVVLGLGAFTAGAVVVMMLVRRASPRPGAAVLAGLLAGILMQLLLAVRGGMANYMVPSLGLAGVTLACVIDLLWRPGSSRAWIRRGAAVVCVAALALLACVRNVPAARMNRYFLAHVHQQQSDIAATLARDFRDYTHVHHYYLGQQLFALFMGNGFAGYQYAAALQQLYPRALFYTWGVQPPRFARWDERAPMSFDTLWFANSRIVMIGTTLQHYQRFRPNLPLVETVRAGDGALTVIDRERILQNEERACQHALARAGWNALATVPSGRVVQARLAGVTPGTTSLRAHAPDTHTLTLLAPDDTGGAAWDLCGFRAANRRLEWPHAPAAIGTGACTIACVIRIGDQPGWQIPLGHGWGTSNSNSPWFFMCDNDAREIHFVMQFTETNGAPLEVRAGHRIPPADFVGWHVIAGAYSPRRNELALYVDGARVATADVPAGARRLDNPAPLTIGSLAGGNLPFLGYVRDVLAFNRALSAREIVPPAAPAAPAP